MVYIHGRFPHFFSAHLAPSTLDLSLVPFQSFWHFEKVFVPVKNNYSNSIICGNFGTLRTYILFKRIYNK